MQVLILNGLVVTLVVLSFLVLRRAPKPPVKLDLRSDGKIPHPKEFLRAVQDEIDDKTPTAAIKGKFKDPRGAKAAAGTSGKRPVGWDNYQPRNKNTYSTHSQTAAAARADSRAQSHARALERAETSPMEKSLNVFFNWNGHTWDAYEVLDVPAGASLDTVYKAFERAKARADRETLPFLSAAYEAVVNTYTLR